MKSALCLLLIFTSTPMAFAKKPSGLRCEQSPSGEYCYTPNVKYDLEKPHQVIETKYYVMFSFVPAGTYEEAEWINMQHLIHQLLLAMENLFIAADEVPFDQEGRFRNQYSRFSALLQQAHWGFRLLSIPEEAAGNYVSSRGPRYDRSAGQNSAKLSCLRDTIRSAAYLDKQGLARETLDQINSGMVNCGFIQMKETP